MSIKLAPSILSADFAKLGDDIKKIEPHADWLHVDVMDGHFVPNITIGPVVVEWIRPITKLHLDVHLMIDDPITYAPQFAEAGADSITFHAEVKQPFEEVIEAIRHEEKKVGVSIRPGTPLEKIKKILPDVDLVLIMTVEPGFGGQRFMPEVLPKISELRKIVDDEKLKLDIEVDGGIKTENARSVVDAGADVLVAGSATFGAEDSVKAIKELRAVIQ